MSTLKEMVSGNKMVAFSHYQHGQLWYDTQDGFSFPVPVSDAGDARFGHLERAMLMMRYIRKHLEAIEQGRADCSQ